jgi:hypothetical protein
MGHYVHQYQDRIPVKEIATYMGRNLARVLEEHDRVIVVAHSMGDLAIRDFLIRNTTYVTKVPSHPE